MINKIIENLEYDKKVTDNFYVITDKEKQLKNSKFIGTNFDLIALEEGFNFGYIHLEREHYLYITFTNEYGFDLHILFSNKKPLSNKIKKYLLDNFEDEILRITVNCYSNSIDF